jgi:3-isopropylmalate/(R)-2-methylmalate dehydratase small subunit
VRRSCWPGENFGTGSSREHAVWALQDHGFRAVVSARFADIFRSNALKGGLLPVQLPAEVVQQLMAQVETDPSTARHGRPRRARAACRRLVAAFDVDDFTRWRLMEGLDDIGLTLRHEQDVTSFEQSRPSWLPTTATRA